MTDSESIERTNGRVALAVVVCPNALLVAIMAVVRHVGSIGGAVAYATLSVIWIAALYALFRHQVFRFKWLCFVLIGFVVSALMFVFVAEPLAFAFA